jgi:hypothetical protein
MNNDPFILGTFSNSASAITALTANLPDPAFEILNSQGVAIEGATSADGSAGVTGFSNQAIAGRGVFGRSDAPGGIGVEGNWFQTNGGEGVGVRGVSGAAPPEPYGIGSGVVGVTVLTEGTGVWGMIAPVEGLDLNDAVGVRGDAAFEFTPTGGFVYVGWAGVFGGTVYVDGDLIAVGKKSAAVKFPDGSHRLLFTVESPESWFEDFGEAKLAKGKARVKIRRDFAAVVDTDMYHVFVTPYGRPNGLCVSERNSQSFVVEEQNGGKSNSSFSYRIVARRKDVQAKRFEKFIPPKALRARRSAAAKAGRARKTRK